MKVPVIERGAVETAIGTGFQPGEKVTGVMHSDPVALGTQTADADGTVTFTWTIPAAADLGAHDVTLTGADSGSVTGDFRVVAAGLATTGYQPGPELPIGAALLLVGGVVLYLSRRKAKSGASS